MTKKTKWWCKPFFLWINCLSHLCKLTKVLQRVEISTRPSLNALLTCYWQLDFFRVAIFFLLFQLKVQSCRSENYRVMIASIWKINLKCLALVVSYDFELYTSAVSYFELRWLQKHTFISALYLFRRSVLLIKKKVQTNKVITKTCLYFSFVSISEISSFNSEKSANIYLSRAAGFLYK